LPAVTLNDTRNLVVCGRKVRVVAAEINAVAKINAKGQVHININFSIYS
jgi:hypothetical protein